MTGVVVFITQRVEPHECAIVFLRPETCLDELRALHLIAPSATLRARSVFCERGAEDKLDWTWRKKNRHPARRVA